MSTPPATPSRPLTGRASVAPWPRPSAAFLLTGLALGGCLRFGQPATPAAGTGPKDRPVAELPSAVITPLRRLFVQFAVLRVEAASGSLTGPTRIWNLVDDGNIPAAVRLAMNDNGFRIGIGRAEAREPLRALLDALPQVCTKSDQTVPSDERMVELMLTDVPRDETVFVVDARGRGAGFSFDAARPVLNLAFDVRPDDLASVWLRLIPEIRQPPNDAQYERVEGAYLLRPTQRGRVFTEASVDARVPKGGFLLLGPTADVRRLPLLARPFFVADGAGSRESVYIISPMMEWAEMRPVPGGSVAGR